VPEQQIGLPGWTELSFRIRAFGQWKDISALQRAGESNSSSFRQKFNARNSTPVERGRLRKVIKRSIGLFLSIPDPAGFKKIFDEVNLQGLELPPPTHDAGIGKLIPKLPYGTSFDCLGEQRSHSTTQGPKKFLKRSPVFGSHKEVQVIAHVGESVDLDPRPPRVMLNQMINPALIFRLKHGPHSFGPGRSQNNMKRTLWIKRPSLLAFSGASITAMIEARWRKK
jgi:hypothetical protein